MDSRSSQAVELIRSRMPIRELVGRYVALKPAGKGRWKGLCPFHQEKTPSFHVDETKGLCYCFGCKAGGDIFGFLQKIEGIDFREALERLAQETGVELPEARSQGKKRELYEVLNLAQEYFRANLKTEALAYLRGRGLRDEAVEKFGLGYAPQSWDGLIKFLSSKGVSPEEGLAAGVLAEREGRYFDRFRHRITFPIQDPLGRTVAFTARTLGKEDGPKYLNSPETPLFKKSLLLYGFPQARPSLRERGRAIVVEGLFDVIALHQMGFTEAVAVLGSGLSPEQGLLLKRHEVREIYLSFDADEAGRKATLQSLELEIARSFLVYAVALEGGKDPGDLLLLPDGPERYQRALEAALPEVEFRFQAAAQGVNLESVEGKRRVLEALLPRLLSNDPLDGVAEALKRVVQERLGLERRALEDYLRSRKAPPSRREPQPNPGTAFGLARPDLTEKRLLRELDVIALLYSAPDEEFAQWAQYVEDHTWPPEGSLLAEFMQVAKSGVGKARVIRHFQERGEGDRLFDALMKRPDEIPSDLENQLHLSMARLREVYYEIRLDKLKQELKSRPSVELLREIQETQRAIEAERRVYKR
ncbi:MULTISPECIES: DNA primase [unclassified Meiothermus]|uniref:DNA primase n=1 Tax=unclassified Meiothermus TaxID=370471 RepID=UPI000D7BCDC4|nr:MULTISPECIES: DNA primase [unclassified Meiothermus]PZA08358.1 DNA primase [Meiothermus sp. Pnk-1]RYM36563.1 DNA primase [Meiothermus sp. PNK-Is4]